MEDFEFIHHGGKPYNKFYDEIRDIPKVQEKLTDSQTESLMTLLNEYGLHVRFRPFSTTTTSHALTLSFSLYLSLIYIYVSISNTHTCIHSLKHTHKTQYKKNFAPDMRLRLNPTRADEERTPF